MKPKLKPEMLSEAALQQVIDDVSPILDHLPSGMIVTLETICHPVVWSGTTPELHKIMGMQLSYLVRIGRLRLEPLTDKNGGTIRYRVI